MGEKVMEKIEKPVVTTCLPFEVKPEVITESLVKHSGKLIVSGIIQRANSLNQNKRFYPRPILLREVEKYKQMVKERRALGELDHPDSSVVNLANASHLITELWWEGDDLLGEIEILSTPSGNILKELFKSGVSVGISSRGLGSTKDIGEGAVEVMDDYEILCWDMVSNPSTQGSFVHPITEGVDKSVIQFSNKYGRTNAIIMDILISLNSK
jgi:hypothetical protein